MRTGAVQKQGGPAVLCFNHSCIHDAGLIGKGILYGVSAIATLVVPDGYEAVSATHKSQEGSLVKVSRGSEADVLCGVVAAAAHLNGTAGVPRAQLPEGIRYCSGCGR